MSKGKKQKRTPSKIEYDEQHPIVSFRIDKELYDQLRAVKEKEGKSTVDVLKIGLGILTVKVKEEGVIQKAAYAKGFRAGYKKAEDLFKITFQCHVCKETIDVTDESPKKDVKRYLKEAGWCHTNCADRGR